MPQKYYLDTAIWIDLFTNRYDGRGEPLGLYASDFLSIIRANGDLIIITDAVITELQLFYSLDEIRELLRPFKPDMVREESTSVERMAAKKIASMRNVSPGDALHALVAKRMDAIVITRDNHFKLLTDMVAWYKPEDLI